MKRILSTIVALGLSSATTLLAQDLPKPSPGAKLEQRVGLTDISIEYSRPGVKDREIWGDLVPYDQIWRAGANKATQFITSTEISINGKALPKGSYSLFIIPTETARWTVIFNKETELWGSGSYDEADDQLRIEVKVEQLLASVERLEYRFINVDDESAELIMDWEKMRATMTVKTDPRAQAMKNIENALADAEDGARWKVYRNAAAYARDQEMTVEGLEWIKKSVELEKNWYSHWVYADLLAQSGDFKGAVKQATSAIEVGMAKAKEDGETFDYTGRIQDDIDKWKVKAKK